MSKETGVTQNMSAGANSILVQAGRDVILEVKKCPPDVRLVRLQIDEVEDFGSIRQKITVIIKNNGDRTAVLLRGFIRGDGHEEVRDCTHIKSQFSLVKSDWIYDVDIDAKNPQFVGKHAIAPNEAVSFEVMVGRKEGGYELSIYRCSLRLEFDEGNPLETDMFYLGISGPTQIAGSYTAVGPTEKEWGRCWEDNIRRLDALGYDARSMIHPESAHIIEKVAPGLMSMKGG